MVVAPPNPATEPTLRQKHLRRCFLLGILESWKVEKLWREEVAKRGGKVQ